MLHIEFRAPSAASLCFESVFEGGNREEGGLKRAAPTHSARSLRPSTKETAAHPPRPRCFGSARAQAARASVSSINGMSMARACFGRRGSAVGMDAIRGCALGGRSARNPAAPDSWRSSLGTSRSRGGRSTAGSRARACCSDWDIGRIGWARSRKRPRRAASRGARGGGEGAGQQHS